MSTPDDAPVERTSLLGGEMRPRRMFGSLSITQICVLGAAGLLGVFLLVTTQSFVVLGVECLVALGVRWAWRRRTRDEESWLDTLTEAARLKAAEYSGADRYQPPRESAMRPVPQELGRVQFASAAAAEGAAPLAVADHTAPHDGYLSTVVEIVGGGDGLRDTRETNATAAGFGGLLYALATPGMPVAQIDVSTRVLPMPSDAYQQWAAEHIDPYSPAVTRENLVDLAARVGHAGETYHSWMTLRMPREDLAARAARSGGSGPEAILEAAWEVTAEVARRAGDAGLVVRGGLGPARLGALVRNLYNPDWGLTDITGMESPRDGFQPYVAHRRGLFVPTSGELDSDTGWWHATASVPRDGWPMTAVGSRWLEALVTGITPATVRTITAQFRLVSAQSAREQAAFANTLDQAEIRSEAKSGKVSTGVNEAQASASARVLDDVVNKAAGCHPALRVTVSAPSWPGLVAARERVHNAALDDAQLNRLRWHDTRHHHAHLLTLPFARGITV